MRGLVVGNLDTGVGQDLPQLLKQRVPPHGHGCHPSGGCCRRFHHPAEALRRRYPGAAQQVPGDAGIVEPDDRGVRGLDAQLVLGKLPDGHTGMLGNDERLMGCPPFDLSSKIWPRRCEWRGEPAVTKIFSPLMTYCLRRGGRGGDRRGVQAGNWVRDGRGITPCLGGPAARRWPRWRIGVAQAPIGDRQQTSRRRPTTSRGAFRADMLPPLTFVFSRTWVRRREGNPWRPRRRRWTPGFLEQRGDGVELHPG